jgi:Reverse transcriptase (RNA-dependent DNA polymerase)
MTDECQNRLPKWKFGRGRVYDTAHKFWGSKECWEGMQACQIHYGLKQASQSWNLWFDEEVKQFDFVRCEEEHCVYKKTSGSAIAILILYVDDILLMGNNIPLLQSAKSSLKKVFSMKDLGETIYILGIKIYRDRSKRFIGLSQNTYIDKVLNRFSMQNSKKGFMPMNHGAQLSKTQCPLTTDEQNIMSRVPYTSAIGSIMYASLARRCWQQG